MSKNYWIMKAAAGVLALSLVPSFAAALTWDEVLAGQRAVLGESTERVARSVTLTSPTNQSLNVVARTVTAPSYNGSSSGETTVTLELNRKLNKEGSVIVYKKSEPNNRVLDTNVNSKDTESFVAEPNTSYCMEYFSGRDEQGLKLLKKCFITPKPKPLPMPFPAQTFSVVYPKGGETWQAGGSYEIAWEYNFPVSKDSVILLALDNGKTSSVFAIVTADQSKYTWTIPGKIMPSMPGDSTSLYDLGEDVFNSDMPYKSVSSERILPSGKYRIKASILDGKYCPSCGFEPKTIASAYSGNFYLDNSGSVKPVPPTPVGIKPVINYYAPMSGLVGTAVKVSGSGFTTKDGGMVKLLWDGKYELPRSYIDSGTFSFKVPEVYSPPCDTGAQCSLSAMYIGQPGLHTFRLDNDGTLSESVNFTIDGGTIACTAEVQTCPDGSTVARDPLKNCKFKACPAVTCSSPIIGCQYGQSTDTNGCPVCKPAPVFTDFSVEKVSPATGLVGSVVYVYGYGIAKQGVMVNFGGYLINPSIVGNSGAKSSEYISFTVPKVSPAKYAVSLVDLLTGKKTNAATFELLAGCSQDSECGAGGYCMLAPGDKAGTCYYGSPPYFPKNY